jgi:hypothetical protein
MARLAILTARGCSAGFQRSVAKVILTARPYAPLEVSAVRQSPAARRRDVGLSRPSLATRWIALATLGLIAALSTLVAHALPVHSTRQVKQSVTGPRASPSRPGTAASVPAASPAPVANGPTSVPPLPFTARLAGAVAQTGPDSSGLVTITISARVSGGMSGTLLLVLRGQRAGAGVTLSTSSARFGPAGIPNDYQGEVVVLNGDQLVASVTSGAGHSMDLGIALQIDPTSGAVRGTLDAVAPDGGSASRGEEDPDGTR